MAIPDYPNPYLAELILVPAHAMRWNSLLAGFLVLAAVGTAVAAPVPAAPNPYPDITRYERVGDLEKFKVTDEDGIWLTTPLGLFCGIGDDGSFGCSGALPGASPGQNEVAWFPGDRHPRLYHADEPRFNSGRGQTIMNGLTYVEYRGSRCAVALESGIYCIHGEDLNSQLLVTSGMTWLGGEPTPAS